MGRETGYALVEADQYFERPDGAYSFNPAELSRAHAWCLATTRKILWQGFDVVVCNTFSRVWEMQPYLDLEDCEIEVRTASGDYGSVHNVPKDAIDRMRNRWEPYPQ